MRLVPPLHANDPMIEARESGSGCRTLVVSRGKRQQAPKRYMVVNTPLEMIAMLQDLVAGETPEKRKVLPVSLTVRGSA